MKYNYWHESIRDEEQRLFYKTKYNAWKPTHADAD